MYILIGLVGLSLIGSAYTVPPIDHVCKAVACSAPVASKYLDLTRHSWSVAFRTFYHKITKEYANTEHKKIDWRELYARYYPQICEAEKSSDAVGYYLALRGFLSELHDGHVQIDATTEENDALVLELHQKAIGGSFGFGMSVTDDGEVIVQFVQEGSDAALCGIIPGEKVIAKEQLAMSEQLATQSLFWAEENIATSHVAQLEAARLAARAPIGTSATFTFSQSGACTLIAFDDALEGYERQSRLTDVEEAVCYRMLESGIGYIKIDSEIDPTTYREIAPRIGEIEENELIDLVADPVIAAFRHALAELICDGATSLIIDLRNNHGGPAKTNTDILGHFYTGKTFYQVTERYDYYLHRFKRVEQKWQTILPQEPFFDGPVLGLIGTGTFSSGESLALGIKNLPQGVLLGFDATSGNYSAPEANVLMPGGWKITFSSERKLDVSGAILIEGDAQMQGGVFPDIKIAKTIEHLLSDSDVVLEAAISFASKK